MTDSTKPQIALVGSYSDAFVKALGDDNFDVEQCDSVPNPATRTSSLAALALKGEEYTLSESDITLMLPAKTVLIFFGPTSTLLETVQSATNTPIDIPSLELVDGLPLLVYMVDGMVNIATSIVPSDAQVLPLVQSALKGNSEIVATDGYQLQSPTDPVEQAVMSIDNAVTEAQSDRAYVSTLDPPIGTIGFKKGTLSNFANIAINRLAWSPAGIYMAAAPTSHIQRYTLKWYTDVYSYATGADCRNKTPTQFANEGGVVYTVVIDRGNLRRSPDSAPRYWGPERGYCGYYFVDHNTTTHRAGSSLNVHTFQPQGPDSQNESKIGYNISYEQDMQMLNNNGHSTFTFKAKYMNGFVLDQFQLHDSLGNSGVEFSVDYNGYYDYWADPKFATKQWWNPGVFEKLPKSGRWAVRDGLPVDNMPINALTVFSSSVGQHTMTSEFSADIRAFKSNYWDTSSDHKKPGEVSNSDGNAPTHFQTTGISEKRTWNRALGLTWT
ncbi:hypothetical protein PC9H_006814 [Pleurotus ostreatus]|uniref:Uncharacterized protein n=1 Tax=Pleurotus ostreatus TaxID=5322 RepID=A0A8H6ZXE0_PLEOS|nr:uncharacterized protein PC9H_006814 [Pleurotus ostreatus]KAF7431095.1 hypothetical protein PC9H_006814 [Pleurotus ostreatus]KAJ8695497.1 hypothetical protein PTI98_008099 [Pleurotus ostreatus]